MKGTSGGGWGQSFPLQMGFSPDSAEKVHFQEGIGDTNWQSPLGGGRETKSDMSLAWGSLA